MSAPKFTTGEMVADLEGTATQAERMAEIRMRYDLDPSLDTTRQAALYRAIAGRLSDPWSAFAGWQPPPEAERADGYRCQGWVNGRWEYVIWETEHKRWVDYVLNAYDAHTRTPTAFAPLPPTPKESTDG